MKLDALVRAHAAAEATGNRHDRDFDLCIDIRRLADDEATTGTNGTLKLAVDAQCVVKGHFALERRALVKKAFEIPANLIFFPHVLQTPFMLWRAVSF